MTLQLEPDVETTLLNYAAAEGLTPDTFIARLLAGYQPPNQAAPEWKTRLRTAQQFAQEAFLASGKTEDEIGDEVDVKLHHIRSKVLRVYQAEHSNP